MYINLTNTCYFLGSDHGGDGSIFSVDKSFDEPTWGTFDTNDDVDSVWGFNTVSTSKVCQFYTMLKGYLAQNFPCNYHAGSMSCYLSFFNNECFLCS